MLIEVSPPAEVITQLELCLSSTHSIDHFHGRDLVGVNTFTVQVELSPEEEEFLAHLVAHVAINDCIALVVLVHHVESLAVPDAQVEALTIDDVVAENALQLVDLGLKVDHDLGG